MPTQKPKEGACELAHLENLLKKIMEMVEREAIHFKAADALKIVELKQKLAQNKTSKEKLFRPFFEMLERAGRKSKRKREDEK